MHPTITRAGADGSIEDPRFPEDQFTRQALEERRGHIAHAHAKGLLATVLGGVVFLGLARAFVRGVH